jgi:hypothetical protein
MEADPETCPTEHECPGSVRLLIKGATPGEIAPDPRIMLNNLRAFEKQFGYQVIGELFEYTAQAAHVEQVSGNYVPIHSPPDITGHSASLDAALRWLPRIYLIETAAWNVQPVISDLLREFRDIREPNKFIEAIEIELGMRLTLSASVGTNFSLTSTGSSHAAYKADIKWSNSDSAGNSITGTNIVVAVLDSGSQTARQGWHDLTATPSAFPLDPLGHGTAMGDIIHDLAPNAQIHDIRVASTSGAVTLFDLMAGILTAVVHVKANVVNMSLGVVSTSTACRLCGSVPANRSAVFEDWFKRLCVGVRAFNTGIDPIFTAAAGNSGPSDPFDWPAVFDDIVAVGSVNHARARSSFSNARSPKASYLLCPGGEVSSGTVTEYVGTGLAGSNQTRCAGTSPATAYASAMFALYVDSFRQRGLRTDSGYIMDEAFRRSPTDVTNDTGHRMILNI